jgi:hypothetical protein
MERRTTWQAASASGRVPARIFTTAGNRSAVISATARDRPAKVLDGRGMQMLCSDREGATVMRLGARIVGFMLVGAVLAFSAPLRAQVCGDGVIDPGETCDPPNMAPGPNGQTTCRTDCTSCGDGVVQANDVETCDEGLHAGCGFCLSSCQERIYINLSCPCAFDDPELVDLRADILAACPCESAASHGAFIRCARAQLAQVPDERFMLGCIKSSLTCLAHSVCGRHGAVTCCRTNSHGRQRCEIKPDAAHCTAPKGGSASLGVSAQCCDACP